MVAGHGCRMEAGKTSSDADLSSLRIDERSRRGGGLGRRLGIFAAALGALVVVTGLLFGLKGQKASVEVAVAKGRRGEKAALLNASGYVTPRRRATVAAKITARVTGVF